MKQFIKPYFMLLMVTGIFLALTPQMFTYADAQRGYNAIGGEMFFPLIPFMLWLIWGMVKDTFKEFKQILTESEENEND